MSFPGTANAIWVVTLPKGGGGLAAPPFLPPNAPEPIRKWRKMRKMETFAHVTNFQRWPPLASPWYRAVTSDVPSVPPLPLGLPTRFCFQKRNPPNPSTNLSLTSSLRVCIETKSFAVALATFL